MLIVVTACPRLQITRREERIEHQNEYTNAHRNNEDQVPFALQLEQKANVSSGFTLDRQQGRCYLGVWNEVSDDDWNGTAGY